MKKRFLSILLTLTLCLTLLPATAWADDSEELDDIAVTAPVPVQGEKILAALGSAAAENMTLTDYSAVQITDLQSFQKHSLTADNSRAVTEADVYEPGAVYMLRFTFSTGRTFAEYDDDLDATYNGSSIRMRDNSDDMSRGATYYNGISDRYLAYPERETPEGGAQISRLHVCALTRLPYPVSTAQELADALAAPDYPVLRIDGTIALSGTYALTGQRIAGGTIRVPAGETLTLTGTAELNCDLELEDGAIITGDGSLDRWNDPTGVIFLGAVRGTNATIAGCAFSGDVTLSGGAITGGVFSREDGPGGKVDCTDTAISGGRFRLIVTSSGTISGGDFASHVWAEESFGSLTSTGIISGGDFGLPVTNRGTITDGSFTAAVTNYGTISGGTYRGSFEDHGTMEPAALRTVTFDSNGGSSVAAQQVLRGQKAQFPETPKKESSYFLAWRDSGGSNWNFSGTPVLEDVTLTAYWVAEQFTLEAGGTYYFDLSAAGVPGTRCSNLPDTTLHYVPFTYTGTIEAYVLNSNSWKVPGASEEASKTTEGDNAKYGYVYPHSLFIADYVLTNYVGCQRLKANNWVFGGKDFKAGGITYSVRIPSGGSRAIGPSDPRNNEWDVILDKNGGWIKNVGRAAWVQDTYRDFSDSNIHRGGHGARHAVGRMRGYSSDDVGFRPVLQPRDPETLGADALKPVTLNLGGATLADGTDLLQIIVKQGASFAAPAAEGLTAPADAVSGSFRWEDRNGKAYQPGKTVPADVNYLCARWNTETHTLTTGKTYYFDLSGSNLPGEANQALPDPTLHYVPFTYAGDLDAYVLTPASAGQTASSSQAAAAADALAPYGHASVRSLFIANDAAAGPVSWNALNDAGVIFGTACSVGGVRYTLRSLTAGSAGNTPANNEYTALETKNSSFLQSGAPFVWAQDTASSSGDLRRAFRAGGDTQEADPGSAAYAYRPVLEVPADLPGDGMRPITLELNGGSLNGSTDNIQIVVRLGGSYTAPASEGLTAPEGQRLAGWYDGQQLCRPGETVSTSTRILSARWEPITYSVTYAPGTSGTGSTQTATKTFGTDLTLEGALFTRSAYRQTGWSTADGGEKVYDLGGIYTANEALTLYPVWTAETYPITYNLNGGTASGNPDTYTVETDTFTLKNPTRPGYTFTGWSGTGLDGENNMTVTIEKGSTGERSYTAHWRYNGGGGSSSSPSYPVSVPDKTDHGSVTVSPKNASAGSTVTITVKPDSGYVLETISVTDKNGNDLKLTNKGNGKYTFTMPGSKVEVKVTFMEDNSVLNFFYDVPNDAYYYEAIKWAAENGITGGVGNSLFAPNQPCTRAQIVTFLWRAAGSPEPKNMSNFSDVPADSYYAKAVAWAVENGITTGTGDGKFSPDATCTRAQSVTFLFRASKASANGAPAFSDVAATAYYAEAVKWATNNGITNGIGDNLFGSDNDCTRAQIVTFLYRMYQEN